MNINTSIAKYGLGIFLTLIFIISIAIGSFIYINYNIISNGITGIVTLCLIFYFGKHQKLDVSLQEIKDDTQKIKYYLSTFLIPMISFWASGQIYQMILFLQGK